MCPKYIYMDVGCWQTLEENQEPVMNFGLIDNNFIALCSFYSNGKKKYTGLDKFGLWFRYSAINRFLYIMMKLKYERDTFPYFDSSLKAFHIEDIMIFPNGSLLEENFKKNTLYVIIPDLHLHFFKNTYLDNFITYRDNKWGSIGPESKECERRSMETDFGIFLESILESQKYFDVKVLFMGDLYEMWETQIIIHLFCILKIKLNEVYEGLKELIEIINNLLEEGPRKDALNTLLLAKIDEVLIDPEFNEQLNHLQGEQDLMEKLYIKPKEKKEIILKKAKDLSNEILLKYHNESGVDFKKLFDQIKWVTFLHGNHDNYLYPYFPDQFNTIQILDGPLDQILVEPITNGRKTAMLFYHHGHLFDKFNSDHACMLGILITAVLTLFEAKKRGDMLKKCEEAFRSSKEVRQEFIKKSCVNFIYWERKLTKELGRYVLDKNKIFLHAHTHRSCLKDISDDFNKSLISQWYKENLNWKILLKEKIKHYKKKIPSSILNLFGLKE